MPRPGSARQAILRTNEADGQDLVVSDAAPALPDLPIERAETLAIIAALSDILFEVRRISAAPLGDDDDEEAEDEP